jgi:hypothetical protein
VTPWRGRRRLAGERVVLASRRLGAARRGAPPAVDLLEPEQDHGDVVAPAGLVGGGDQRAPELVERAPDASSGLQPRSGPST